MRITLPSAFRTAAPALALLVLASVTALPARAQYGSGYYSPGAGYGTPYYSAPYGTPSYSPGYYGNSPYWNNASYYVYQNNPNRYSRNNPNTNTDFGYAVIPPAVNPDAPTTESEESNTQEMYLYNFTGGVGPVYENRYEQRNLYCFPC
jgi:hypothetical protein